MLATEALELFRLVARLVLGFIPVDDLKDELTAADVARAKALNDTAKDLKFGPR